MSMIARLFETVCWYFLALCAVGVFTMWLRTLGAPEEHGYTAKQRQAMDELVERVLAESEPAKAVILYQTEAERLAGIRDVFNAGREGL